MSEGSDRDPVDARLRRGNRPFQRHAARRLKQRATGSFLDGTPHLVRRHVVEQHDLRPHVEGFIKLGEGVDLNLDRQARPARAPDRLADSAGGGNVVVLDQDRVKQAGPVVVTAARAHCGALEKAKTDFMNIASHELRGPMTVIKGYLTMLEGGSLGNMPAKAQAVLPLMIVKADEVNSMVEQMLEAARLEEGHLTLHKERGDIIELTELAIDSVRPMLSDHPLDLEAPHEPVHADIDGERFQIVVRNLVSNAIKYSPDNTPIKVLVEKNGGTAKVKVVDQGIGIAPADQEKVFEDPGGARRTDSGVVQIQRQLPVFTQGAPAYDVLVAADESEIFASYLPYRTWDARPVAGSAGLVATSWDGAHDQWGAVQLQDRFMKRFSRRMTARDMQAWTAVRMIGEGSARTRSADPKTMLDFLRGPDFALAAFKGQRLTLRDWNLQLRQPILLSDGRTIVSVSPQEGFLHQVSELDTLGIDRPESKCKLK